MFFYTQALSMWPFCFFRGKFVDVAMNPFNEISKIGLSMDNFRYNELINDLCTIRKWMRLIILQRMGW
jgi:hypothetical protein